MRPADAQRDFSFMPARPPGRPNREVWLELMRLVYSINTSWPDEQSVNEQAYHLIDLMSPAWIKPSTADAPAYKAWCKMSHKARHRVCEEFLTAMGTVETLRHGR